jgi:hypothetical protein
MELEGSLPHSQDPATCPYPELLKKIPKCNGTQKFIIVVVCAGQRKKMATGF